MIQQTLRSQRLVKDGDEAEDRAGGASQCSMHQHGILNGVGSSHNLNRVRHTYKSSNKHILSAIKLQLDGDDVRSRHRRSVLLVRVIDGFHDSEALYQAYWWMSDERERKIVEPEHRDHTERKADKMIITLLSGLIQAAIETK